MLKGVRVLVNVFVIIVTAVLGDGDGVDDELSEEDEMGRSEDGSEVGRLEELVVAALTAFVRSAAQL